MSTEKNASVCCCLAGRFRASIAALVVVHSQAPVFLPLFAISHQLKTSLTTLPLCFPRDLLNLPDFQWRAKVLSVCEVRHKNALDFPADSVIESEIARAPAPSAMSMRALWQHAGQLLDRTCLYPSSARKRVSGGGGGGGVRTGTWLQLLSNVKGAASGSGATTPSVRGLCVPITRARVFTVSACLKFGTVCPSC